MTTIKKILELLNPHERRRGFLLLGIIVSMAFLHTVGFTSIMPMLAALGDSAMVQFNSDPATVYDSLDFRSVVAFLLALGVSTFGLKLFSAVYLILSYYGVNRFVVVHHHSLFETR